MRFLTKTRTVLGDHEAEVGELEEVERPAQRESVCVFACVCVCACVRKREGGREGGRQGEIDRQIERERKGTHRSGS